jgi:signal transduction histidine kinase
MKRSRHWEGRADEQTTRFTVVNRPAIEAEPPAELREANEQLLLASLRERDLAAHAGEAIRRLRALLETMSEGVTVFDGEGNIVLVNDSGRRLLDCFASVPPCTKDYEGCDLRTLDGVRINFAETFLARLLRGEGFSGEEVVLLNAAGAERFLVFSGSAVRDEQGPITLAINLYRDVTALKVSEQLREQYVSLVSHDLRGPLAAARMVAQLLAKDVADLGQRRAFALRIVANLDRMERMIHDLLDSQQIRGGHGMPLSLGPCDVAALAREVAEDLHSLHNAVLSLHGETSVVGTWSAEHLRRAIWNLVSNAIKYGTAGEPIKLCVEKTPELARISVHNRGNPISAEEQAFLFNPFVRAKAAVSGGKRGWGLGLTLVRGCAEAHGGRVFINSSTGQGTTFTIELPLVNASAAAAPP